MRAIADFERTYFGPGAVAEAFTGWARFVHGPARIIDDYSDNHLDYPCCPRHDPADCRAELRAALLALPAKAARELRALVRPLDDLYLARSIPHPEHAHLRGLLE
ncbi:hypothetical protein [Lentzea kentuckyensis]|uniref:hypothetical protein n=1 Tax=Lentzea kentuckyensis TaxID=360086 RepID=UPI000A38ACDF|nr:hypothetical protein [Lentzea kentuckyensis]